MAGRLERRLGKAEGATAGGAGGWNGPPCEECGWRGPDDNSEPERYLVTWVGDKDFELVPLDEYGEPKEFCMSCGRKLVWFVAFEEGSYLFYLMIPKEKSG